MENGAVPDKKSPVEQAFEVFVYAPLGLALEARSLMPRLIERGRNQVMMARMIGKFAVRQGQSESTKVLGKASVQASAVLSDLGLVVRDAGDRADSAGPAAGDTIDTTDLVDAAAAPPVDAPVTPQVAVAPAAGPAADAAPSTDVAIDLAIADFDSLAASQVIPRLPGLSSAELEAVRNYEVVHRGRKTVLNRIAQLQSA